MKEEDLCVFVEAVKHYFAQHSETSVEVQTPYLRENKDALALKYTGIIGISGQSKGCVYFSAPQGLLRQLLLVLKESDVSHDNMCDLVGEVANTISGNARRHFGSKFMISVPVVVSGNSEKINLPKDVRSFVVPVLWRSHESVLVVCIE